MCSAFAPFAINSHISVALRYHPAVGPLTLSSFLSYISMGKRFIAWVVLGDCAPFGCVSLLKCTRRLYVEDLAVWNFVMSGGRRSVVFHFGLSRYDLRDSTGAVAPSYIATHSLFMA